MVSSTKLFIRTGLQLSFLPYTMCQLAVLPLPLRTHSLSSSHNSHPLSVVHFCRHDIALRDIVHKWELRLKVFTTTISDLTLGNALFVACVHGS